MEAGKPTEGQISVQPEWFYRGNEFSDHIMEAKNYLYLAHSNLPACSFGPELIIGAPPAEISGQVRIERNGQTLWQAPFLTGEERMSYTISNLEHHHFKYELFRKPGDVHCHFFGTATLSRNTGVVTQPGGLVTASKFSPQVLAVRCGIPWNRLQIITRSSK